jgi:MtrB/PioB family decaheme-associated outer membrane protein
MKNILLLIIVIFLCLSNFQVLAQRKIELSGEQTLGVRQVELNTNSSKFNEYRDIRNGLYLQKLRFEFLNTESSWLIEFNGRNLLLDDQFIRARIGDLGNRWSITVNNNKIPHRLSNKALTPFFDRGNGFFTVSERISIGNNGNGTPSLVPTTGQMAVNDSLIADYLGGHLRPVNLGIQREKTSASLELPRLGMLNFNLNYSDERRNGNRSTYGPIGDRPPRTLNIQLPEPVSYTTREVHADAGFITNGFQANVNYLFSMFDNKIESMRWENIFLRPTSDLDYLTTVPGTPRNVSNFAQRSLAPDNFYHNISLSAGLNLPLESRLTTTVALGFMRQDEELLPYSFSTLGGDLNPNFGDGLNWNDPGKLPRRTADAEMKTLRFDMDYKINPISTLNFRPFVRYYKLDNNTPTAQWKYVTQDVAGTDGNVNYRNYRSNLAYAFNKLDFGIDASQYISFWRSTLSVKYTRENIDRKFREANTNENIFNASLRTRPVNRLTLSAGFLYGNRNAGIYDYKVNAQSYWYSFEQGAADVDNPKFLFEDHPDLRKFDVSDRKRNELNFAATFAALDELDLSAAFKYRNDDFDSNVKPVAPLAGTTVPLPNPADANAMTPGQQLGLLKDKRQNIIFNAHFTPSARLNIYAFADREDVTSDSRGMIFNENQRREPSDPAIQAPTALGPWTDPNRIFNVKSEQKTNTLGLGFGYDIIPGKFKFSSDFSLSLTDVDLDYTGYGSDPAFLGRDWETFAFGFNTPATIKHNQYTLNSSLEYQLLDKLTLGFHYLFSKYDLQDWMQAPLGAWVENVGSEFYWRDTSRDNRWGNRLINLGSYLAPSYDVHAGYVSMTFQF